MLLSLNLAETAWGYVHSSNKGGFMLWNAQKSVLAIASISTKFSGLTATSVEKPLKRSEIVHRLCKFYAWAHNPWLVVIV